MYGKRHSRDERGFTLIELLVVVLIIGILSAIAIPVFLNQQTAARKSATQTWVSQSAIQLETYYLTNSTFAPSLAAAGITVPDYIVSNYYSSPDAFCFSGYYVGSDWKGNGFGPVDDTWKVVVFPFYGKTSFTPTHPDSFCVNTSG